MADNNEEAVGPAPVNAPSSNQAVEHAEDNLHVAVPVPSGAHHHHQPSEPHQHHEQHLAEEMAARDSQAAADSVESTALDFHRPVLGSTFANRLSLELSIANECAAVGVTSVTTPSLGGRSTHNQLRRVCVNKRADGHGCTFFVWATKRQDGMWEIIRCDLNHMNCQPTDRSRRSRKGAAKSTHVLELVKQELEANPSASAKDIHANIMRMFGNQSLVNLSQVRYTLKIAKKMQDTDLDTLWYQYPGEMADWASKHPLRCASVFVDQEPGNNKFIDATTLLGPAAGNVAAQGQQASQHAAGQPGANAAEASSTSGQGPPATSSGGNMLRAFLQSAQTMLLEGTSTQYMWSIFVEGLSLQLFNDFRPVIYLSTLPSHTSSGGSGFYHVACMKDALRQLHIIAVAHYDDAYKTDSWRWFIEYFKQVVENQAVTGPDGAKDMVVVSQRDDALSAALAEFFPTWKHKLCTQELTDQIKTRFGVGVHTTNEVALHNIFHATNGNQLVYWWNRLNNDKLQAFLRDEIDLENYLCFKAIPNSTNTDYALMFGDMTSQNAQVKEMLNELRGYPPPKAMCLMRALIERNLRSIVEQNHIYLQQHQGEDAAQQQQQHQPQGPSTAAQLDQAEPSSSAAPPPAQASSDVQEAHAPAAGPEQQQLLAQAEQLLWDAEAEAAEKAVRFEMPMSADSPGRLRVRAPVTNVGYDGNADIEYVVDLKRGTSSSGFPQYRGMPCRHLMFASKFVRDSPEAEELKPVNVISPESVHPSLFVPRFRQALTTRLSWPHVEESPFSHPQTVYMKYPRPAARRGRPPRSSTTAVRPPAPSAPVSASAAAPSSAATVTAPRGGGVRTAAEAHPEEAAGRARATRSGGKREIRCGWCGATGHNRRSCPPSATHHQQQQQAQSSAQVQPNPPQQP